MRTLSAGLVVCIALACANCAAEANLYLEDIPEGLQKSEPRGSKEGGRSIVYRDQHGVVVVSEEYTTDMKILNRKIIKDRRKDGIERNWYPNGRDQSVGHWRQGLMHGDFKEWSEDGVLTAEYTMQEGTGRILRFWPNDRLQEEANYLDGERVGVNRRYHEDGRLKSYIDYSPGKASFGASWSNDGELNFFSQYDEKGLRTGIALTRITVDKLGRRVTTPEYWIADEKVSADEYKKRAAQDASLPAFKDNPNDYLVFVEAAVASLGKDAVAPTRKELGVKKQ